jgi:coenzyme PQQ precursor peptide PqqA
MNSMNEEKWVTPEFEEVSTCMECTAYAETLD